MKSLTRNSACLVACIGPEIAIIMEFTGLIPILDETHHIGAGLGIIRSQRSKVQLSLIGHMIAIIYKLLQIRHVVWWTLRLEIMVLEGGRIVRKRCLNLRQDVVRKDVITIFTEILRWTDGMLDQSIFE